MIMTDRPKVRLQILVRYGWTGFSCRSLWFIVVVGFIRVVGFVGSRVLCYQVRQ